MILCALRGGFFEAFCNSRDLLVEHAVDGCTADQVVLRQLAQAVALLAVAEDGGPIEDQGLPPMCRPSSLARRMPARTRSMIKLRSSSAMAPMMTAMAGPGGPPVSMFSRKLTYSMLSRLSSSRTSRKCLTDLAIRSEAQTSTTSKRPRRASDIIGSSPGRLALAPLIRSVYSWTIS